MNISKTIAIILIVAGALGLAYKGFTYTKETHDADIGNLHLSVDEKERVTIPGWLAALTLAGGVVLLWVPRKT